MERDDIDPTGQWVGRCADCGTDHDGYWPGSFGASMRCLRIQAEQQSVSGAPGLLAAVDQLDAEINDAWRIGTAVSDPG